jgi:hypothetical protein
VQPRPCRLVAAKPQESSQTFGTASRFLGAYPPHGSEPHLKRFSSSFHDCSGRQRRLVTTPSTYKEVPIIEPSFGHTAFRAPKTLRPSNLHQILPACLLVGEESLELVQRLRELIGVHDAVHYRLW